MVLRNKHPPVSDPVPNKTLLWSPLQLVAPHLWQAVPVVCGVDREDDGQLLSCFTKRRMFIRWRQCFPQVTSGVYTLSLLWVIFFFWLWFLVKLLSHVQLFATPMDWSLPGSSVHGIFQARVLEQVAISSSRRSSQPRDWTRVSCIVGRHFTIWATREVQISRGFLEECSNIVLY